MAVSIVDGAGGRINKDLIRSLGISINDRILSRTRLIGMIFPREGLERFADGSV